MDITSPYIIELAKTLTNHWYHVWKKKGDKKGTYIGVFPSVTTILNAYPQSAILTKWIADNGWDESQEIKEAAGKSGTKIHAACDTLEDGGDLYERDFTLKEWYKIDAFVRWHNLVKPELIAQELAIFSKKGGFAGRLDRIYKIGNKITLLDLKSSSAIHEHFPLQFSSYAKAIEEMTNLEIDQTACLQLGASNKDKYRYVVYTDWRDHYKVFENVQATWQYEYFGSKKNPKDPPVLVLPDTLRLER
jgi:hypothetical protein